MRRVHPPLAVLLTALLLSFALSGCGVVGQQLVEGLQRAAKAGGVRAIGAQLPVGEAEEREFGGAIAVMIVQRFGGLVKDEKLLRYVGLVGNAVAAVSSRANLQWHFGVLDSDEVNAMSAPGGYVFITRGALKRMKSEAELAGVLAHEIGHVTKRHAVKIISNLKSLNSLSEGAAMSAGPVAQARFRKVVDGYLKDYLTKGLPKETEYAADKVSVILLARIGYRTTGLRTFLSSMAAAQAIKKETFHDTHPDTADRLQKLDTTIASVGGDHGVQARQRFRAAMGGSTQTPEVTERPAGATTPPSESPSAPTAKPATQDASSSIARPSK